MILSYPSAHIIPQLRFPLVHILIMPPLDGFNLTNALLELLEGLSKRVEVAMVALAALVHVLLFYSPNGVRLERDDGLIVLLPRRTRDNVFFQRVGQRSLEGSVQDMRKLAHPEQLVERDRERLTTEGCY